MSLFNGFDRDIDIHEAGAIVLGIEEKDLADGPFQGALLEGAFEFLGEAGCHGSVNCWRDGIHPKRVQL